MPNKQPGAARTSLPVSLPHFIRFGERQRFPDSFPKAKTPKVSSRGRHSDAQTPRLHPEFADPAGTGSQREQTPGHPRRLRCARLHGEGERTLFPLRRSPTPSCGNGAARRPLRFLVAPNVAALGNETGKGTKKRRAEKRRERERAERRVGSSGADNRWQAIGEKDA